MAGNRQCCKRGENGQLAWHDQIGGCRATDNQLPFKAASVGWALAELSIRGSDGALTPVEKTLVVRTNDYLGIDLAVILDMAPATEGGMVPFEFIQGVRLFVANNRNLGQRFEVQTLGTGAAHNVYQIPGASRWGAQRVACVLR